ncbi:MAG: PTS sugar transporter subunit IIB [Atopobiaceae bacterium]|jgi:PTS system mannose-specific IIB component|nr:PTS sugar transporter subunit IIB [Atopobiaceae bacterium]MCH4119662.1 PTS sugar transporter subunit IIB [Atopobiaceae bacterium]MCI1318691.1 PTS sugar transporter subunit IIB [Atopobiaceae bacterium]MCI1388733.1 PTS sugar transporter subunit IIB [Atopobiaceae bacterium]MCI1432647.1 PTS sugar transporter subunit IIB [Atopobiaceae bacterium]
MIGLVLAAHGDFAEGVVSAVELLLGKQEHLEALGLRHGDSPEAFEQQVVAAIDAVDTGDGALCLVDLLGGTPSNVVMRHLDDKRIQGVSGLNVPMLLEVASQRDKLSLDDAAMLALKTGMGSVQSLGDRLQAVRAPKPIVAPASTGKHGGAGEVVLTRVDDRLIHGQVMTSWLKVTGANKIMIVDDETAKNDFLKSVFRSAVPSYIGVGTFNEKKAVDRLKKGFNEGDKVIVLVKYPQTVQHLVEQGAKIDSLVVGGMGARDDRTTFFRNISASDEERETFRKLIDEGVKVRIQILADDKPTDVAKLL